MATGGTSPGWGIMRLFSPRSADEEEDPQTAPQQSAHSSSANPSPVVLEDMSTHGGIGHADAASQANPSARDTVGTEVPKLSYPF